METYFSKRHKKILSNKLGHKDNATLYWHLYEDFEHMLFYIENSELESLLTKYIKKLTHLQDK